MASQDEAIKQATTAGQRLAAIRIAAKETAAQLAEQSKAQTQPTTGEVASATTQATSQTKTAAV